MLLGLCILVTVLLPSLRVTDLSLEDAKNNYYEGYKWFINGRDLLTDYKLFKWGDTQRCTASLTA